MKWLSEQVEEKWKTFGRRLQVQEAKLTEIDWENMELSEKMYKLLQYWKQETGLTATYTVLHEALCHSLVSRADLADKLCRQQHE